MKLKPLCFQFNVGDRLLWTRQDGSVIRGEVVRVNVKTLRVGYISHDYGRPRYQVRTVKPERVEKVQA